MKKRVLIITDSLGFPRKKAGITLDKTWTGKIVNEFSGDCEIYTIMQPGLTTEKLNTDIIKGYEADVIICQFGIVDACRRALRGGEQRILGHIPLIGELIHSIVKRHHFFFTKVRCIHYANIDIFKKKVEAIVSAAREKCIFISIAPPGDYLIEQIFNVAKDVDRYNRLVIRDDRIVFINPYESVDISDGYLLEDGHHLSLTGEKLVYESISNCLKELLNLD